MNNLELNEVNMMTTVVAYSDEYQEITSKIPNFLENKTILRRCLAHLQDYYKEQQSSNKWISALKENIANELIILTVDSSGKLSAFGLFTKNPVLQDEMKINRSKMNQSPDSIKRDLAQLVYDRAQANLTQLEPYGINAETQAALLALINRYNEIITKPGVVRAHRGQTRQQKDQLFKDAHEALANMDAGVEIVWLNEPEFYKGYRVARKVINRGKGSLALMIFIKDATTGEGIRGATVTVAAKEYGNGNGNQDTLTISMLKRSAAKGGVYIKSIENGEYTLTVTKSGYNEYSGTVNITSGERAKVMVALRRK